MSRELVLVVGGSSDLGAALIRRLLADGDTRIIAHHQASAERIERHERVQPIAADFASTDAVESMADRILSEIGVPDGLVYLAGLKLRYERFAKFDLGHFERDFAIQ